MKISNRIPTFEKPEIESPVDKYKGPDSLPEEPKSESRIEKYKRSQSRGPQPTQNPDEYVDLIRNGADDFVANFGRVRQGLQDQDEESTPPQIASRAEKYKGPDSFELPKASSEVEKYKGPDSMKLPEIISEVDTYKGPKSLAQESRIESLLGDYKGSPSRGPQPTQNPDEYVDLIRNGADDFVANFGRVRQGHEDPNEESTEPKTSSRVEKYKGPDSLKRAELESQVDQYKGPKRIGS